MNKKLELLTDKELAIEMTRLSDLKEFCNERMDQILEERSRRKDLDIKELEDKLNDDKN